MIYLVQYCDEEGFGGVYAVRSDLDEEAFLAEVGNTDYDLLGWCENLGGWIDELPLERLKGVPWVEQRTDVVRVDTPLSRFAAAYAADLYLREVEP